MTTKRAIWIVVPGMVVGLVLLGVVPWEFVEFILALILLLLLIVFFGGCFWVLWKILKPPSLSHTDHRKDGPRESPPDGADVVEDPVFGTVYDNGPDLWSKDAMEFAEGLSPVFLSIPGDDNGPSQHARDLFVELQRRYPDLQPAIAERLFRYCDEKFQQRHGIADPQDFYQRSSLAGISLYDCDEGADLELGFRIPCDPEHTYEIELKDWSLTDSY